MTRLAVVSIALILILTACANGSTGSGGNPGLAAADAQATLAVVQVQQRQAAESTRQSSDATAAAIVAQMEATAQVAQAATAEAVAVEQAQAATAESLSFAATAQALTFAATQESYAIASTAQAVNQIATAEAAIVADEARRLEIARQAEIAAIERGRLWNTRIWPAVAILLAGTAAAFLAALTYRLYQRSRPAQAHQVGDRILILAGNNQPYQIAGPRVMQQETPLITAGEPVVRPSVLPPLPKGHVLVIGPSQSGKSTTVKVIAAKRPGRVIALDPHSAGGNDWGHAEVIGTSRNFNAISEYLSFMEEELNRRYQERGEYSRDDFEPLTVAVDETPAIVKSLGNKFTDVWATWVREGWKVGLFVAMSSQSDRVRTLGIEGEGDVRENFAFVLYLRDEAVKRFGGLVAGMERPIVLRTPQGARPIVIPQEDLDLVRRPSSDHSNGNDNGRQPFILPAPAYADPDNVTHADKARIRYMLREGFSQRAIEKDLYGYNGGKAYTAVKQVKDGYDAANGSVVWGAM
jgi:hypothetical protein